MLFVLKQESGSHFIYLLNGKEYVVGRKNADIIIANDQSISRKHATIKVENNSVKLIDCGSKYGTCHKDNKIEANIEVNIENQDLIKFGVFQSIYKLEKIDIVTTGSGLNNTQKIELKKNVELLGGSLLKHWESACTYLTLQELVLSVKALHALLDDKPCVTLDYWKQFIQNMKANQPPPKLEDFKPTTVEMFLHNSLMVSKPERKVLFKGKIFVFPTQKIKSKMEDLILKTGGKSISWDKDPINFSDVTNSRHSYIFITSDEIEEVPKSLQTVYEHLRKVGQRTIPIQEIAMAILSCSCEQDCNPRFNKVEKVFMKIEGDPNSEKIPLALETQSQTQQPMTQAKEELVVPGSLESNLDRWNFVRPADKREPFLAINYGASTSKDVSNFPVTPKRPIEEPEENASKKAKLSEKPKVQQIASSSKKRKADENFDMPSKKTSLHDNLFDISRTKTNKKSVLFNPFANLRVKQEKCLDNPFLQMIEQKNDNSIEEIAPESKSLPLHSDSSYSYRKGKKLSEITWLSKPSEEIKMEDLNIEMELRDFYDKFKNCVKIEVLPPFAIRANISNDSIDGSIRSGSVKNFKKFKKVQPKKPQSNIISTTLVHTMNTTNREVIVLSGSEEEDAAPVFAVERVNNRASRFEF